MQTNVLYYGDNLQILRKYLPDQSVELIYLDPPFNSNRDYNVIFRDESGRQSDAQLLAFEDTWHWGPSANAAYAYLTETARNQGRVPARLGSIIAALRQGIGENQMMAYLVEMAVRLVELHRVLKATGSLYLHCDPTASHYLKVLLDGLFGPTNFVNEIIWKRSDAHSDFRQGAKHLGRLHDVLLFYRRGPLTTFNDLYTPLSAQTADNWYKHIEPETGRRYNLADITGPGGAAKGNPYYEFLGVKRYWRYSKERMQKLYEEGRIIQRRPGTVPAQKRYLDDSKGVALQDIWTDIDMLRGITRGGRLGYPTEKPLSLLERIINISSKPGDLVLDPFCGCGTALIAAEELGRRWIGIDITYLAIGVMQARLQHAFPGKIGAVRVIGQPTEVEGARQFALSPDGRYQFQWWAVYKVGGFPLDGERKGADLGIDGKITFNDVGGKLQTVLISVKSGQVHRGHVAELRGTIEREKAAIGILITLEEPTEPMRLEAAKAGLYTYELLKRDYPRIQILTVREMLEQGKQPNVPPYVLSPYPQAARAVTDKEAAQQLSLPTSGPQKQVLVDREIAQRVAESRVAKAGYRVPERRANKAKR